MTEQRFIRNIMGNIYDTKNDKWFEEDWKGKPLDYDDDLIVMLNELNDKNEQLRVLLKEAEDEIKTLKQNNKGLMESIVEKDEQINKFKKEVDEYKEAIINKVQYYEDIEDFAIKKGLIKKDWAKFDGYD